MNGIQSNELNTSHTKPKQFHTSNCMRNPEQQRGLTAPSSMMMSMMNSANININNSQNHQASSKDNGDGNCTTIESCRSLVCDPEGIIIAEIIYRCMVCSQVHESVPDARAHYEVCHMDKPNGQQKPFDNNKIPHRRSLPNYEINNMDARFNNTNPNNNNYKNLTSNQIKVTDPSIDTPDMSDGEEDYVTEPWKFLAQSQCELDDGFNDDGNNIIPKGSSTGFGSKGGHVTCAVCGLTRYYSYVTRRYGQFSCVTCYRYFRGFLIKPKKYGCPFLGSCPLNTRTRCRACWILACMKVYKVDSKRREIIMSFRPVKKAGNVQTTALRLGFSSVSTHPNIVCNNNNNNNDQEQQSNELNNQLVPYPPPPLVLHQSTSLPGLPQISVSAASTIALSNSEEIMNDDCSSPQQGSDSLSRPEHENGDSDGEPKEDEDLEIASTISQGNSTMMSNMSNYSHQSDRPSPLSSVSPRLRGVHKVWPCGKCATCMSEDCGECRSCKDKPKFGGAGTQKQRCLRRKCLMKLKRRRNATLLNSA